MNETQICTQSQLTTFQQNLKYEDKREREEQGTEMKACGGKPP